MQQQIEEIREQIAEAIADCDRKIKEAEDAKRSLEGAAKALSVRLVPESATEVSKPKRRAESGTERALEEAVGKTRRPKQQLLAQVEVREALAREFRRGERFRLRDFAEACFPQVHQDTVRARLVELEALGVVEREGERRSTRWFVTDKALEFGLTQEAVPFDSEGLPFAREDSEARIESGS